MSDITFTTTINGVNPGAFKEQLANCRSLALGKATQIYKVRGSGNASGSLYRDVYSKGQGVVISQKLLDNIVYAELDCVRTLVRETVDALAKGQPISVFLENKWVEWGSSLFAHLTAYNTAVKNSFTSWEALGEVLRINGADYVFKTYDKYVHDRKLLKSDMQDLMAYCQTYALPAQSLYDVAMELKNYVIGVK